VVAHGFASPRHRGFANIGNQCCTDSARTVAHDDNAGKSDDARILDSPFRAQFAKGRHKRSDGDDYVRNANGNTRWMESVPFHGIMPGEPIVRMHPGGGTLKMSIFSKMQRSMGLPALYNLQKSHQSALAFAPLRRYSGPENARPSPCVIPKTTREESSDACSRPHRFGPRRRA
jgi:hypothetical protein